MNCSTRYWEFTAKLFISSDLTYQIYTVINAWKQRRTINSTRTTTPDVTWFTPSVGATSTKLCFIQLATKPQFDLRTQLQIPSSPQIRAHSSRPLRTYLQIFLNLLTKTLYAHSCRGRPRTQLGLILSLPKTNLTSPYLSLHQKS